MSWFHRPSAWAAAVLLPVTLACGSGTSDDQDDHVPVVDETDFLDWDQTAQWPAPYVDFGLGGSVLNADGTRMLVTQTNGFDDSLRLLNLDRAESVRLWSGWETPIRLFRSKVSGDDLWTFGGEGEEGLLNLWDISELDLKGPVFMHAIDVGTSNIHDFHFSDDHLYVGSFDVVRIFDRAAAEAGPLTASDALGTYTFAGATADYTVTSQTSEWLWLGGVEGKTLLDVGDPTAPFLAHRLGDANEQSVAIVGDQLVSSGRTWNVSDPPNPTWTTMLHFSFGNHTLLDDHTLMSVSGHGLAWADFSVSPPVETRFIPFGDQGGVWNIHSNGDAVFLQDYAGVYRVEQTGDGPTDCSVDTDCDSLQFCGKPGNPGHIANTCMWAAGHTFWLEFESAQITGAGPNGQWDEVFNGELADPHAGYRQGDGEDVFCTGYVGNAETVDFSGSSGISLPTNCNVITAYPGQPLTLFLWDWDLETGGYEVIDSWVFDTEQDYADLIRDPETKRLEGEWSSMFIRISE